MGGLLNAVSIYAYVCVWLLLLPLFGHLSARSFLQKTKLDVKSIDLFWNECVHFPGTSSMLLLQQWSSSCDDPQDDVLHDFLCFLFPFSTEA